MRIGIISDTHDQMARTEFAVEQLISAGAEALFHCGDLVEPEMFDCFRELPLYYVFGNNDDYYESQIRQAITQIEGAICLGWSGLVELDGKRIAMTHGHLNQDLRELLFKNPDYLFSGHSHLADDWKVGSTRRINPGALHRASSYSVAVLDLKNDQLEFIEIPR